MDEPSLECAEALQPEELELGTWLVALRADGIPHVVLVQGGVCFSLEHDGNQRYPARQLWRLIEGQRIPTLLCRLAEDAPATVAAFFAAHERIQGEGDCFRPVRDYCAAWLSACGGCEFAFELLPLLAAHGRITRSIGLNLTLREGRRFVLPRYTRSDIRGRIEELRGGA